MNAHRVELCRSGRGVGRGETPAVGDDAEVRRERLDLGFKCVQIPQPPMNEDDRLPATALQIVQSCVVDLDPLDLRATGLRLTCCIPD